MVSRRCLGSGYTLLVRSRPLIVLFLAVCCAGLFAYSSIRAYRLSFTHDESLSYDILTGNTIWKDTANHHPLNTRLMRAAYGWLGSREWQLRLPNLVAHLLYLAFGMMLLVRIKPVVPMLLGFALLNLNPFLLDFFGLARGYGLASGLSMAALFFLYAAWQESDLRGTALFLLLSLTFASLADLSNYTWLNLHLALFGASILIVLVDQDRFALKLHRPRLVLAAGLTIANAWFIYRVALRIWRLKTSGELYARGKSGFLRDTVGSLVDSYLYTQSYSSALRRGIIFLAVGGFVASAVVLFLRLWQRRKMTFSTLLFLMLVVAIAAPIVEHHFFGTEYPVERIALYYVPLSGILAAFVIGENMEKARVAVNVSGQICGVLLIVGMVFHFSKTANLHSTLIWSYDADTKAAMLDLGRHFGGEKGRGSINIGTNWIFEPTINFYRKTLPYDWLNPTTRDRLLKPDNDAVLCYPEDLGNPAMYTVLDRYPGGTVLYRSRPAVDSEKR